MVALVFLHERFKGKKGCVSLVVGLVASEQGGEVLQDKVRHVLVEVFDELLARDLLGVVARDVARGEGEARINNGEASGFLTIPEGFQDAFLNETPVTLTLKTNPAQTILPGIIENVTEILLDAGFYLQRLLAIIPERAVGGRSCLSVL